MEAYVEGGEVMSGGDRSLEVIGCHPIGCPCRVCASHRPSFSAVNWPYWQIPQVIDCPVIPSQPSPTAFDWNAPALAIQVGQLQAEKAQLERRVADLEAQLARAREAAK